MQSFKICKQKLVNKLLNNSGYETIVLDNLSKGHKYAVKWGKLVNADLSETDKVREIFQNNDIIPINAPFVFEFLRQS